MKNVCTETGDLSSEDIRNYLNERIAYFKKKRDEARAEKSPSAMFPQMESTEELRYLYYLETYKAVKIDIFGTLKEEI